MISSSSVTVCWLSRHQRQMETGGQAGPDNAVRVMRGPLGGRGLLQCADPGPVGVYREHRRLGLRLSSAEAAANCNEMTVKANACADG